MIKWGLWVAGLLATSDAGASPSVVLAGMFADDMGLPAPLATVGTPEQKITVTVKGAAALTVEAIATATGAWSADLKVAASAVAATITVTGDGSQPPTVLTGVKLGGRGLLSERSGADPTTVIRCVGNCDSRVARPAAALPGLAMCGGHMYPGVTEKSDDDVYRWMIDRAKGGDFVVLTADPIDTPCDLYNGYIYNLSTAVHRPNSVTTICFTNRSDSLNPKVAELLKSATAVFITGGDQSKYFDFWSESPVSDLLSKVPLVGGSSAGLAVLGRFVFDALQGGVDSEDALKYPMDSEISLTDDLLSLRWMATVLTDTHFFQRDRMGRLMTFLARATKSAWGGAAGPLGVAVSEHTAVLVDGTTGDATFTGVGPVYLLSAGKIKTCDRDHPLGFEDVDILKWNSTMPAGSTYSFAKRTGTHLKPYTLSAVKGKLVSSTGSIY